MCTILEIKSFEIVVILLNLVIDKLITKSWIKSKDAKFEDAIKSNFINDWNGDLVYATSATPKKWTNTPSAGTISFITKEQTICVDIKEFLYHKNID